LETERALASAAAETRGFLISGDTNYLPRVEDRLAETELAFARLEAAESSLEDAPPLGVGELELRIADWIGPVRELVEGRRRPEDFMAALEPTRQRYDAAFVATAQVDLALRRIEDHLR